MTAESPPSLAALTDEALDELDRRVRLEVVTRRARPEALAKRLRQSMTEGAWSISRLSRRSGVARFTIGRILHTAGKQLPDADTIGRLALALEISPGWLTYGEGRP